MFLQNIIFQWYLSDFFDFFGIFNQSGLILCMVFNTASYAALQIPQDVATFHWQFKRTTVKLAHIRLNLIIVNDIFVQKCMSFILKRYFSPVRTNLLRNKRKICFRLNPFCHPPPPPHPAACNSTIRVREGEGGARDQWNIIWMASSTSWVHIRGRSESLVAIWHFSYSFQFEFTLYCSVYANLKIK